MNEEKIERGDALNNQVSRLVASLRLLIMPYPENLASLGANDLTFQIDVPFEVLDTFYKASTSMGEIVENNYYDDDVMRNLDQINLHIDTAFDSEVYEKGTDEEIFSSVEFLKIRNLAGETLVLMGEEIRPPDSQYL